MKILADHVSIRTRPNGRVMRAAFQHRVLDGQVSIRTRPNGRVMLRRDKRLISMRRVTSLRDLIDGDKSSKVGRTG